MKINILAFCAALTILSVASVKADETKKTDIIAKTIETSKLRGVRASAGFDVTIKQARNSAAVVSVSSSLQPYLTVEVEDGILVLGFDNIPNQLQRRKSIRKAEVTLTSLEKLRTSSGARIVSNGSLVASDDCEVRASSGSRIEISDLKAQEVSVDVSSGASIAISGTADGLDVEASSGSSTNLSGLKAQSVNADASSGATINCLVVESLTSHASSGASVRYGVTHSGGISAKISNSSGGSCRQVKF